MSDDSKEKYREHERDKMKEFVELESKLFNMNSTTIEEALFKCIRHGINIEQEAERKRRSESGSEFLDNFIEQQAYGTCIGSGDDMYYVDQCYEYFKKQIAMWREFEKRVRDDEKKKVTKEFLDEWNI